MVLSEAEETVDRRGLPASVHNTCWRNSRKLHVL